MNTVCDCLHGIAEIQWRQNQRIDGHYQFQIAFMVELVNSFLIDILIVILRVIVVLHKRSGTEIIDGRRNAGNSHGEII